MRWISIDPGLKGAVIEWEEDKVVSVTLCAYGDDKMPDDTMMDLIKRNQIKAVVIEKTSGITGQSATAAFNFGLGCGCWYGAVKALGVKLVTFTPNYWTRIAHRGLLKSIPPKERSRMIVAEKYPWVADMYPKADGVWDAVCIGLVARKEGFV